jgi:hypothetical protein
MSNVRRSVVALLVASGTFVGTAGIAAAHEVVSPPAHASGQGVGQEGHLGPDMTLPSAPHQRAHTQGLYTACEQSPVITKAAQGC